MGCPLFFSVGLGKVLCFLLVLLASVVLPSVCVWGLWWCVCLSLAFLLLCEGMGKIMLPCQDLVGVGVWVVAAVWAVVCGVWCVV